MLKSIKRVAQALGILAVLPTMAFAADFNLKIAHVNSEATTFHKGLEKFKDLVEERSGGRITGKVFGNAQLGNERDNIEGLQMGTIDVAAFSTAPVSAFVPDFDLLSAPMLFTGHEHAFRIADGKIGTMLNEQLLSKQKIRNLGYIDTGSRHVYSIKPVRSLDDMKGLKIRVMENSLHIDTFTALGAIATPMASGDVFTALSQGTIDAAENTLQYINNMKMYEVCKYTTLTGHFYGIMMIAMSERTFQKLPEDLQKIVLEAGREASLYQRELSEKENESSLSALKEQGVEIIEIDRDALAAKLAPVYEKYSDVLKPDLLKYIREN